MSKLLQILKPHALKKSTAKSANYVMQNRGLYKPRPNKNCSMYLAGKNVSKSREGVIEGLVVNGLVQVLDEDVTNTTLSK